MFSRIRRLANDDRRTLLQTALILAVTCSGDAIAEDSKAVRTGDTVIVTATTAPLQDVTKIVGTVKKGQRLPVQRVQDGWVLTVTESKRKKIRGWINMQNVARYRGWGLQFDGTDNFAHTPGLDLGSFKTITMEVWVRDWKNAILCQGRAGDPENSLWLSVGKRAGVGVPHESCGWESDKGRNFEIATGGMAAGKWHHVALVYDGSKQSLFVDGKLIGTQEASKPGPFSKDRLLYFGAHEYGRGLSFGAGVLDSVRISKTVRYRAEFQPTRLFGSDAETVLLYDIDEGKGAELRDASGNGRHAKIIGAQWVRND